MDTSRTRAASPALVALALGLACTPGGEEGASSRLLDRPNIVLITIDTLRADHLGCYGYFRPTSPVIDALARESIVFDQAYATMATTLPSHASILTARYPLEHGILANVMHGGNAFGWKEGMTSFASVAKEAGYATAGFVSAAPLTRESGIDAGFDTWSEPTAAERRAGDTLEHVLPWIEGAAREPFFLWVHFYDPHWKYRPPAPYDSMFKGDGELERWIAERRIGESVARPTQSRKETATRQALDDYCGEVRYTDDQVGRLLDALRARGLYDDSVIVLTADHGEGLNQHDWAAHGLVWDEQLRVPLLMRFPGQAGVDPKRVPALVSLIDLFPTVLARMAPLDTPLAREFLAQATGVDVLAPEYAERPLLAQRTGREVPDDPGEVYSLTTREWKFVQEPEVGDQLFDRAADPFELVNLVDREPVRAARLRDLTRELMAEQARRGADFADSAGGAVDPALLEKLRELGYAGGDDGRSRTQGDGTADKQRRGE